MTQYIDKDVLVAEINKRIIDAPINNIGHQRVWAYNDIKDIIDTLEVKEMNFERELSKYVSNGIHRFFPNEDDDYCKMDSVIWQDYVIETAKHFFELGLKSLRPQPKQGWSEEDALRFEEVICMIEANGRWVRSDDAVKSVLDWLKSLKPHKHWKPSDEQMNDLKIAIDSFTFEKDYLQELYEDLKKLREE